MLAGSPVWGRNEKLRIFSALLLTALGTRAERYKQALFESPRELSITVADVIPDINYKRDQM